MKYRDRTTGTIYIDFELRQKFSNVSFPTQWDTTTLDFLNVDEVIEVPPHEPNKLHRLEYTVERSSDNSKWIEVWKEVLKYDNPIEQSVWEQECLRQEREDTHEEVMDEIQLVRTQRDVLLQQTDYTQLPDTPITDECRTAFKVYRQTLRDINLDNPYNINWPNIPIYEK